MISTPGCVGGCTDSASCNYDAAADYDDGTCDYSCIGCTDPSAANYNPNATINQNCVFCDPGTFFLQIDMADSFGDGWNGAEYLLYELNNGTLVTSGSLNQALKVTHSRLVQTLYVSRPVATTSKPQLAQTQVKSLSHCPMPSIPNTALGRGPGLRHRLHFDWSMFI